MPQWMSWLKSNEKEILAILNNLACKAEEVTKLLVDLFSDFDKLNKRARIDSARLFFIQLPQYKGESH